MHLFHNLPVKVKLVSGFCLSALFCAVVGWFAVTNLGLLASADTRLYERVTVPTEQLGSIAESIQRIRISLRDALMTQNKETVSRHAERIEALNSDVLKTAEKFAATIMSSEMSDAYKSFRSSFDVHVPLQQSVLSLAAASDHDNALQLLQGECREAAAAVQASVDEMKTLLASHKRFCSSMLTARSARSTRLPRKCSAARGPSSKDTPMKD